MFQIANALSGKKEKFCLYISVLFPVSLFSFSIALFNIFVWFPSLIPRLSFLFPSIFHFFPESWLSFIYFTLKNDSKIPHPAAHLASCVFGSGAGAF